MKELIKVTNTTKETKYVLTNDEVLVNGKRKRDFKTPVGFLDIITIKSTNRNFVITIDNKGALRPKEINENFNQHTSFNDNILPYIMDKKYDLDTNQNGEDRSFVMTGQYERVFPFDIYPVHLVKSIMVNDIESMEKLGIYEVAPEDFALCEYVCTSKINVQEVVRKGLDVIYQECM
jgi:hypothetical protein